MTLSLEPDPDMRWIYDPAHRDYHSKQAQYLRAARAAALRSAPRYMLEEARFNDAMKRADDQKG